MRHSSVRLGRLIAISALAVGAQLGWGETPPPRALPPVPPATPAANIPVTPGANTPMTPALPSPVTTLPSPVRTVPSPVSTLPSPATTPPTPITTLPSPVTTPPTPVTAVPSPVTTPPSPVTTLPPVLPDTPAVASGPPQPSGALKTQAARNLRAAQLACNQRVLADRPACLRDAQAAYERALLQLK